MKNTIILFVSLGFIVMTTACGSEKSEKQTAKETVAKTETKSKGGTEIKELTETNWQAVVKANYGIEMKLPEGWSLKSAKSPNSVTNVNLMFEVFDMTVAENFAQSLFDAAKTVSSDGIFKLEYRNDRMERSDPIENFESTIGLRMDNCLIASWNYKFDSKTVQFNFFFDAKKGIEISFNRY